ncbi:unnamed protein product [Notodromas monacha]|uniref:C3H1-type domain-containing protein n=1 Tax=Notodromas monacha TaxID=399045 RepID=A0A7R9BEH3_9CRUS|nr:unnamed protein product [Notodromas monacha]CAG0913887.1 unnamed protein product [Notodromas monacha]
MGLPKRTLHLCNMALGQKNASMRPALCYLHVMGNERVSIMPPKPSKPAVSKKTEMKKKEKVIEDKTFGLKNKKGAKMQKFVQQVEKQVKSGPNVKASKLDPLKLKKKEDEEDLDKDLFKPVIIQKVIDKNVDPKSVVCAFFKQGQCTKGDKCKFSHDLAVERKTEKRSMYVDERSAEEETMEDWDEAKLEEVVNKKHSKTKPTTDIICKFFLDAVESSKYGWFWECPNGNDKCHYRHALPPGFVLKKDKKKLKELEKENALTLEELIEDERKKLDSGNVTKVTLESFLAWKRKKRKDKKELQEKEREQKRKDFKLGRSVGISGREMFDFDPSLIAGEDDVEEGEASFDISAFKREDNDADANETQFEFKEIDLAALTLLEDDEEPDQRDEPEGAVGGPIDESLFDEDALGLDDDELNGD